MHDVSMLSDEEVTIEGEKYELEKGDVVSLSFTTARNYVNQFGIAEFKGSKYPVTDDAYEDEVGPTGENVEVDPEANPSQGTKEALESDEDEETQEEPEESDEEIDPEEGIANEEYLDNSTVGDVEQDVDEILESGINDESTVEDDVMYLNALLDAEEDNQDRKGVKTAIEEAIEELEEDESEADDEGEESEEEEE